MSEIPDLPQPDPALRRLDRLVGSWTMGRMREYWRSPDEIRDDGLLMDLLARELEPA